MSDNFERGDISSLPVLVYKPERGGNRVEVLLDGETVWLSQQQMAELFKTSIPNINIHINKIYKERELLELATVKDYLIVRQEGKREVQRSIKLYNLEMIIAVGFRINSQRGTQFRQWAIERLNEYLVKGFTMDDERLKSASGYVDYFDELLSRIRDIRASEVRVYQRIKDIFAMAVDYRDDEEATSRFFASMQNKMHFAATGMTAAEIISVRADSEIPNMNLKSWKGQQVRKKDVGIAKNYLDEKEIDILNRITVMFLDQAEFRTIRRQNIYLDQWEEFLDQFLRNTELPVLEGSGSKSRQEALDYAHSEYDTFAERRRVEAEVEASKRYIEDLKNSVKYLSDKKGK